MKEKFLEFEKKLQEIETKRIEIMQEKTNPNNENEDFKIFEEFNLKVKKIERCE